MSLKRVHMLLAVLALALGSFVIPGLSAYSSYIRSIQTVDQKLNDFRIETAKTYPEKKDLEAIDAKLDRISNDLSVIKGWLKAKDHEPLPDR